MAVLEREAPPAKASGEGVQTVVLARLASASAVTRAELIRDVAPLVAHRWTLAEWRAKCAEAVADLTKAGALREQRQRISITDTGALLARQKLGDWGALDWREMRDVGLVGVALGFSGAPWASVKTLARPEALRAAVLQTAFGLPVKPKTSVTRLRAQLAVVALERAFGNKIKSGLGQGSGLSGKAGRLLAGQLSRRPRDFGSDGKLIAALAAEQLGVPQLDEASLRLALIRRFVFASDTRRAPADAAPSTKAPIAVRPANDTAPVRVPDISIRPDLPAFASEVLAAARANAEGWPGNRKAYISRVWQEIDRRARHWALSEIEFKCMLQEAHRSGHLTLTNADLKDKRHLADLERSAITYKNTVWHFVRVDE